MASFILLSSPILDCITRLASAIFHMELICTPSQFRKRFLFVVGHDLKFSIYIVASMFLSLLARVLSWFTVETMVPNEGSKARFGERSRDA